MPLDSPSLNGFSSTWGRLSLEDAYAIADGENSYFNVIYSGWDFMYGNDAYSVTMEETREHFRDVEDD